MLNCLSCWIKFDKIRGKRCHFMGGNDEKNSSF